MKFDFTYDEVVQLLTLLEDNVRILEADRKSRKEFVDVSDDLWQREKTLRALRIKIGRAMDV